MNVLDAVFKYWEQRVPPSNPNPEEDVYNMRYRNRYFSLFPEDLNEDYNPYDFIEEPVEPRSFRKILTGLIGWTVVIPFILFLLLYQKNIETLSSLVVDRQSLSTLLIKTKLDSADTHYHNLAAGAVNEIPCGVSPGRRTDGFGSEWHLSEGSARLARSPRTHQGFRNRGDPQLRRRGG